MSAIQTANGQLSPREIQMYRNLVKTSIVVILLSRLGRPSGSTEIASILGISRDTAASYLESLNMIGLVTRTDYKGGYRLTDDGQQLMLHVPAGYVLDETHAPSQEPHVLTLHQTESSTTTKALLPGKATSEIPTFVDLSFSDGSRHLSEIPTDPGVQKPALEPQTSEFPTLECHLSEIPTLNVENSDRCSLKKEEESLTLKNKESSSFFKSANVEIFDTGLILAKTDMLFSEPVISTGLKLDELPGEFVLGWIAQAYDQREHLKLPAGLVYSRLRDEKHPAPKPKYAESPESFLPAEYLHAIGCGPAPVFGCDECEKEFGSAEDLESHWQKEHFVPVNDASRSRKQQIKARLDEIEEMRPAGSSRIPTEYIDEYRALHKEMVSL